MGQSVRRKEDGQFITGTGRYTDDVQLDGALHAFVLRSPYAHAEFQIDSTQAAEEMAGVHLVLTAADIPEAGPLKCQTIQRQIDGTMHESKDVPLLCEKVVRHVGDAVAFIVAET